MRGEEERGREGEKGEGEKGDKGTRGQGDKETRREGDRDRVGERKKELCQYAFNRGYESIVVYLMPLIVLPHNYVFHETTIFKPLQHL